VQALLYLQHQASRGQAGKQGKGQAEIDCKQALTYPAPLIASGGGSNQKKPAQAEAGQASHYVRQNLFT